MSLFHPGLGIEKMQYDTFRQRFANRRISQIPTFFSDFTKLQLPNESVLYTIGDFPDLAGKKLLSFGEDSPLVINETWPIFMAAPRTCVDSESRPIPLTDHVIMHGDRYFGQVQDFYQKNKKIHRLLTLRNVEKMQGVLLWLNYTILTEMVVTGMFSTYRKFDVIFRTILDQIASIGPSKHHFIHFPQGSGPITKSQIIRAVPVISRATFPHDSDPSLFPILHLLAFIYGMKHEVSVTPYGPDKQYYDQHKIPYPQVRSSSLFERLDKSLLSQINLVFSNGTESVVYNLGDMMVFGEDVSFFNKVFTQLMTLRHQSVVDDVAPEVPVSEKTVPHDEPRVSEPHVTEPTVTSPSKTEDVTSEHTEEEQEQERQVPVTKAPVLTAESAAPKVTAPPISIEATLRDHVKTEILKNANFTDPQKEKAQRLLDTHLNTAYNGAPIGSYLTNTTQQPIRQQTIPDIGPVVDPSYRHATLKSLDGDYRKHGFHQDIAKVLSVLPKHGMFVKSIDHEVINTELDHLVQTKVILTDLDGRQHSIPFTFPVVDDKGYMRIGGIQYRMTRQMITVPICKVSSTRVNLMSNYNKAMVERTESVRNTYGPYLTKYLTSLKADGKISFSAGKLDQGTAVLPYDYTVFANTASRITFDDIHLTFNYFHRFTSKEEEKALVPLELKFGTYIGYGPDGVAYFIDQNNQVHEVLRGIEKTTYPSLLSFISWHMDPEHQPGPVPSEWTQLKLLSASYPLVYVLGYRFGLSAVLKLINLDYRIVPKGQRYKTTPNDITVKFLDGTMIFPRYPLSRSFIAAGLNWADLSKISLAEMESKGTYGQIFTSKRLSPNYLKGIDNFFEFFIDPITMETLENMKEPTNVRDLLLRASVLLTDCSHDEVSSVKNHRFRGYERFAGILYNEYARQLANYRNNRNTKKGFSVNPQAVFQMIVQDQTMSPVNTINPIHEVKEQSLFTYSGAQGRTSTSFVTKDRVFSKDSVGVISETTPDSGKVGINAYTSISPNIKNLRGMIEPSVQGQYGSLTPTQILSTTGVLMPGVTKDDNAVPQSMKISDGSSFN